MSIFKKSKERKEEIKRNREKLKKEGFFNYFVKPTINFVKEKPLYALFLFFGNIFLYYMIFTILQGVYYDTVFCDASLDEYDGRIIPNLNDFVAYVNDNQPSTKSYYDFTFEPKQATNEFSIECKSNFTRWWESDSYGTKFKRIMSNTMYLITTRFS